MPYSHTKPLVAHNVVMLLCTLIHINLSAQVLVNSEFTVNWSVPRAAKTDGIGILL